jgi:imidazolonepropionase-like amidohydrolase
MANIVLTGLSVLDTENGRLVPNMEVAIRGKDILAVGAKVERAPDDQVVDLAGRVLMPGLIDCHVHLHRTPTVAAPTMLPSLITAYAGVTLEGMLKRGFTTIRDAGGADAGHRMAVEQGLFEGPRVFVAGRAISQTGGHGDARSPADLLPLCGCPHLVPGMGRIADGVDEVRKAVRDEYRLGADQIKLMAGGGVASQTDPIAHLQYSTEEIEAVVDEATRANTYVMAHVYTAAGVKRCIKAGVRTIEHGHLIDDEAAGMMAEAGAYLAINLAVYQFLVDDGVRLGYPPMVAEKAKEILDVGVRAVEIARKAGVKIAFATDMARMPQRQGEEFLIRASALTAAESIYSATVIGAEVVRMPGRIGVVKAGAIADLVAVDGNPLDDISLLARGESTMALVMKEGRIVRQPAVPRMQ